MWWALGGVVTYLVGAFFACRWIILFLKETNERGLDRWNRDKNYRYRHDPPEWGSGDNLMVGFGTIFWPVVVAARLLFILGRHTRAGLMFLMFPRGIKTRYTREKERQREKAELERKNAQLSEEIKRLSKEYDLVTPEELS